MLQTIGNRFGTDKGDANHSFLGHSYLDVYEQYFAPLRHDALTLLELGVLCGDSLRMWAEYFPAARIAGLDIEPRWELEHDRIRVFTGCQADPICIAEVLNATGRPSIIIDDASHITGHIAESFRLLWPALAPGGWYVIEDLRQSYSDGSQLNGFSGMSRNGQFCNDRRTLDRLFLRLIRNMDHHHGDVRTVQFHPMQLFIQKV